MNIPEPEWRHVSRPCVVLDCTTNLPGNRSTFRAFVQWSEEAFADDPPTKEWAWRFLVDHTARMLDDLTDDERAQLQITKAIATVYADDDLA